MFVALTEQKARGTLKQNPRQREALESRRCASSLVHKVATACEHAGQTGGSGSRQCSELVSVVT